MSQPGSLCRRRMKRVVTNKPVSRQPIHTECTEVMHNEEERKGLEGTSKVSCLVDIPPSGWQSPAPTSPTERCVAVHHHGSADDTSERKMQDSVVSGENVSPSTPGPRPLVRPFIVNKEGQKTASDLRQESHRRFLQFKSSFVVGSMSPNGHKEKMDASLLQLVEDVI